MTASNTLTALELQVQVLEMRMMGKSVPAIAKELGVDKGRVTRAYNTILKDARARNAKVADEQFIMVNAQYGKLLSVWMPKATGEDTINGQPNIEAAKLVGAILKEVRELNGTDRPKDAGEAPRLPPGEGRQSPLNALNINVVTTGVPSQSHPLAEPEVIEALPHGLSP